MKFVNPRPPKEAVAIRAPMMNLTFICATEHAIPREERLARAEFARTLNVRHP